MARRRGRAAARGGLATVVALAACVAGAPAAYGAFGISAFDGSFSGSPAGEAYTQAGGHPYEVTTTFRLNTNPTGNPFSPDSPDGGRVRDVVVDLPVGLVGDPDAVATCRPTDFVKSPPQCPLASQIGVQTAEFNGSSFGSQDQPVYNLEPAPGLAAEFGSRFQSSSVFIGATVRAGDYGIRVTVRNISQVGPVTGASFTFWGVPADPRHDLLRRGAGCSFNCSTGVSPEPFLSHPPRCSPPGEGLLTKLHVTSWNGETDDARFISHNPPGFSLASRLPFDQWGAAQGLTGCDRLAFTPALSVTPHTSQPDSPTGLTVNLSFPQAGL